MKRRGRHLRTEQILVSRVGELKEGQRAAIGQAEEQMAVGSLLAEQLVGLAPGRDQRQPDDVLVEWRVASRSRDVRGVMQSGGQVLR